MVGEGKVFTEPFSKLAEYRISGMIHILDTRKMTFSRAFETILSEYKIYTTSALFVTVQCTRLKHIPLYILFMFIVTRILLVPHALLYPNAFNSYAFFKTTYIDKSNENKSDIAKSKLNNPVSFKSKIITS